jgi:IMP dehydrogenase
MKECLEFDDVLIRPLISEVSSRDDVDISVKLSETLTLKFPLIASPMVGVVDAAFAKKLSDLGGLAVIHRFYETHDEKMEDIAKNLTADDNFGISIKIGQEHFENYLIGINPKMLVIDTANGYTEKLLRYVEEVKNYIVKYGYKTLLMAGNVVTGSGCRALYNSGCDIIRVGIGGGSPCSTRNQTGIGVSNISAIADCFSGDYKIMIDGGIKNSGDFVKAVVAGADLGMSGKLFAQCFEAPNKGVLYGMASRTHMKNTETTIKSVEGFDIQIQKQYSLAQFVSEFGYGIKSAGTYLNARSLEEIYLNGEFVRVTDSAIKKNI